MERRRRCPAREDSEQTLKKDVRVQPPCITIDVEEICKTELTPLLSLTYFVLKSIVDVTKYVI